MQAAAAYEKIPQIISYLLHTITNNKQENDETIFNRNKTESYKVLFTFTLTFFKSSDSFIVVSDFTYS